MPFATVHDLGCSYEAFGRAPAPAVFLIHDLNADQTAWHGQLATLTGFVAALRDHLRLERTYLMGHGFGGAIALAFALANPAHLEGPILVGTSPQPLPEAMRRRLSAALRRRTQGEGPRP